jgi:hypothetical protein
MLHAQRLLLIFAYISIIFAMAYIGFAFTAGHFWKERNADQPKVSKNSSLIHPALHSASLRSGFPPYASRHHSRAAPVGLLKSRTIKIKSQIKSQIKIRSQSQSQSQSHSDTT